MDAFDSDILEIREALRVSALGDYSQLEIANAALDRIEMTKRLPSDQAMIDAYWRARGLVKREGCSRAELVMRAQRAEELLLAEQHKKKQLEELIIEQERQYREAKAGR